jgi:hypothetical protein
MKNMLLRKVMALCRRPARASVILLFCWLFDEQDRKISTYPFSLPAPGRAGGVFAAGSMT